MTLSAISSDGGRSLRSNLAVDRALSSSGLSTPPPAYLAPYVILGWPLEREWLTVTADNNHPGQTDQLNAAWQTELSPEIYHELRVIAHAQLRSQKPGGTLNTTALIHEAYVKLGDRSRLWQNRKHFYATMAKVMRQVTVDLARRRQAQKRPQGRRVDLEQLERGQLEFNEIADLIAIDAALNRLGQLDARLERVMELRFFGGMSVSEVAELMGCSTPTVKRDTRAARAFLASELGRPP